MSRRVALRQLGSGQIQLLGSDCHGVNNRSPKLGEAVAIIRKKYGDTLLQDLNGYAQDLLSG